MMYGHTIWAKSKRTNHLVSIDGGVYSYKLERLLTSSMLTDKGYVRISHGNSVHREVAMLFIPNLYSKPEVNHINGIKIDNRIENLEWVTASENSQHSHNHLNRCYNNTPAGLATGALRRAKCETDNLKHIGKRFGNLVIIGTKGLELECKCLCNGTIYYHNRKYILPELKYKKKKRGCIHCTQQRRKGIFIDSKEYPLKTGGYNVEIQSQ